MELCDNQDVITLERAAAAGSLLSHANVSVQHIHV